MFSDNPDCLDEKIKESIKLEEEFFEMFRTHDKSVYDSFMYGFYEKLKTSIEKKEDYVQQ